tara:strand:+ start:150 stop:422 length:273 start_codon:yes stop_codon:yes gene_type:complete
MNILDEKKPAKAGFFPQGTPPSVGGHAMKNCLNNFIVSSFLFYFSNNNFVHSIRSNFSKIYEIVLLGRIQSDITFQNRIGYKDSIARCLP